MLLLFTVFSRGAMAGPKTDTVFLFNGDRITGEIKRFEYGILFFKTDGMGTLNIEFDRIKTFYSKEQFTVQLANGLRFFGTFDTSGTPGYVILKVNSFSIKEPIAELVEIYPVKNAFWKRLDGAIDMGYSFSKASTVSQFNVSGNVQYRAQKSYSTINASSIFTDQQDRERIRKQDYSASYNYFFRKSWFAGTFAGFQQNTQLGTDSRFYGGLGLGVDIVQNNLNALSTTMGVLVSSERSSSDTTIQSLEGVFRADYRIFKFNDPEISVFSYVNAYPSLTNWGRYRLEFELNARIEIFSDFYFGINLWDNYDSQPIDEVASKNDWGVSTSFGYSW